MPTVFTHAAAATAFGRLYAKEPLDREFWALSILCSVLPDADVIGLQFGVPHGTLFAHRGLTHSLFFAAAAGWTAAWWFSRKNTIRFESLWLYFFLVTASHGVLDAFTGGGRGIAFFAPFHNARYFFPWRPIAVSPIGTDFFSSPRMWRVIATELLWVWLPFGLAAALSRSATGSSGRSSP